LGVDHYYGRTVTGIGSDETPWWIELEGGVKILSDVQPPPPLDKIVGEALLNATMSQTSTVLNFGHAKPVPGGVEYEFADSIAFSPTKYSISDPEMDEGEPVYPQKAPETPVPIPDPWLNQLTGPPPGSDSPLAPPPEGTGGRVGPWTDEEGRELGSDEPEA
jgi:hypothetical protein